MLRRGNRPFVDHILIGVKRGVLTVGFRNLRPQDRANATAGVTFQERADGFGFASRVVRCSELGEACLRSLGAAKSTCLSRASVTVRFPAAMSPSPSFSLR